MRSNHPGTISVGPALPRRSNLPVIRLSGGVTVKDKRALCRRRRSVRLSVSDGSVHRATGRRNRLFALLLARRWRSMGGARSPNRGRQQKLDARSGHALPVLVPRRSRDDRSLRSLSRRDPAAQNARFAFALAGWPRMIVNQSGQGPSMGEIAVRSLVTLPSSRLVSPNPPRRSNVRHSGERMAP